MKLQNLLIAGCVALMPGVAGAFTLAEAGFDAPEASKNDSTGFVFTDIKVIPTTPVKDQNKSGTCWCFAATSYIEDAILRNGGPEMDLSEMFWVRHAYIEKAKKYVRTQGHINFAQGGGTMDVIEMIKEFGAMPEEAYTGLNYGEKKHSHYEMYDALKGYLDGIIKGSRKHISPSWIKGFTAILDNYLGEVPEKFTYKGKTYTPKEFAKAFGIDKIADNSINVTSYTHHPFFTQFAIELADNWTWAKSYNVPLADLKTIIDNCLENGYTVAWAADVSEGGFKWYEGYAILPAEQTEANMSESELSKWTKMSDKDREAERFKKNGPQKEVEVTQELRQQEFDSFDTTDDHGMVIVGIAKDQEGNRFYKVKNSWDTNQVYDGYFYVSEPYLLSKTIFVTIDKQALPKDLAKKMFK